MASNNVVVTISAKDQLTGHLRGIRGQLAGMGSSLDGAGAKVAGLSASFIGLAAGVATTAFAVAGLGRGLKDAMSLEITSVSTADTLMTKLGISTEKATSTVSAMLKEVSSLSAALPGSEDGYMAAFNASSSLAAKTANGDTELYKKNATTLAKTFGLMGASTNSSAGEIGEITQRLLSGQEGFKELSKINSLQKNEKFTDAFKGVLKTEGIDPNKGWQQLTDEKRMALLIKVSDIYANPAYIAKLSDTADGYFQSLMAGLFSPVNGLFGFMRDLPGTTEKLKVNALSSVKGFLKSLNGLFEAMKKMGGGVDPMVLISKMFDSLAKTVRDITSIISKGGDVANDLANLFTVKLTDGFRDLTKTIQSVDWAGLGQMLGSNITKVLTDDKLGIALEQAITAGLQGLADAVIGAIKGSLKELTSGFSAQAMWDREVAGTKKIVKDMGQAPFVKASEAGVSAVGGAFKDVMSNPFGAALDFGKSLAEKTGLSQPLPSPEKLRSSNTAQPMSNTININGANSSPQEIAAAVMNQINSRWQDRTNASLA